MAVVSTLSFIVLFAAILEILLRKSDFFSPCRLYLLAHSLSLGVAYLAFDDAMSPFQLLTWIVYLGGGAAFLLGATLSGGLQPPPERASFTGLDDPRRPPYNWRVHLMIAGTATFCAFLSLMIAYRGAGAFPLLAANKMKAMKAFMGQPIYLVICFAMMGIFLGLLFMARFRPGRPRSILADPIAWVIAVMFSLYVLILSRVGLMFFIMFAMVYYHQVVRRLSFLKIALIFFVAFAIVVITGYSRVKDVEAKTKVKFEKIAAIAMKLPYVYIANNFWNLDYALNPENHLERHPRTYGFTMAEGLVDVPWNPFFTILRADTKIDDQFNRSIVKKRGLNTVTYHWTLYKDFGLPGVIFGSLLIGMAIGFIYRRLVKTGAPYWGGLYAFLAFFVANSVFGFLTESPIYTYGLLLTLACLYLGKRFAEVPPRNAPPAAF